jgi:hypothetical protein
MLTVSKPCMFYHAAAPADYNGDDKTIFDTGNKE